MKKWEKPQVKNLLFSNTEYDEDCTWQPELFGVGNEEYTDPNNQPAQHPDWVWCTKHNRWHPKNHGNCKPSCS